MTGEAKPTSRLRVMMIGPYPVSPHKLDGGVASATTYLSRALVDQGEIDLVGVRVLREGDESREHLEFGWPMTDLSLGRRSLSSLYRRQSARLSQLIRRYRPNIIHAQGVDVSGYLAVRCKLPAVITIHGLLAACARLQTGAVARLRAQLAAAVTEVPTIRRAKNVIAISPYVKDYYGDDIKGRVHQIPNAIAPAFFSVERAPERGRLLYAGRIANGKGLAELLRATQRNAGFVSKLVLAGSVPDKIYEDGLRRYVREQGLEGIVTFAGLLSEAELLGEFSRAEALILPSHQETAPMVIQQAMGAGLAVIATNVGGIPHQLRHDETGLLFDAGDEGMLSALIGRIATEPGLGQRLGTAAKHVARTRFEAGAVAKATTVVYHAIEADNVP